MGSASMLASAAMRRLEGKVALITGGASGIGECTARLFLKYGAKVIIADIQDDLGHSVSKTISDSSSSSLYIHCDVTKENDIKDAVDTAVSKYGKLDIMFNNASIVNANKTNILDNQKSEFEKVINVNLIGAFPGTKHAARVMVSARRASIISTASVAGCIAGLATHAYTSSKHAVVGLTKNAAIELGWFGIRVNCVMVAAPLSMDFFRIDDEGVNGVYSNLKV